MGVRNYESALSFILRWEGGLSDHPNDPGGRTMKGVTQATYDAWRKARNLPIRDVAQIAQDELGAIYRDNYWRAAACERLRAALDLVQFDTAVNMGPRRAVKILQTAVGATADGAFGPNTQAACDACALPDTTTRYCDIREGIYRKLAQRPGQDVFLAGWLNRLDDLRGVAGVPGFSPSRSAPTEFAMRVPDLDVDQQLEAWP
jgi:lysozyme family protein